MAGDTSSRTLTLVFTDIEGSTRALQQVGDRRYAELLDIHLTTLRETFARHGEDLWNVSAPPREGEGMKKAAVRLFAVAAAASVLLVGVAPAASADPWSTIGEFVGRAIRIYCTYFDC